MPGVTVVALDVGSLANLGWCRDGVSGESSFGTDLDDLIEAVAADLVVGTPVALGFEAPLFIPLSAHVRGLNRQRVGDAGRPWCAAAGAGVLALGIQQATYVFAGLARRVRPTVTFDLQELLGGEADLLIWEAFVTGKAKNRSAPDPHVDDARRAVHEFRTRLEANDMASDVHEPDVLNVAAAGLLASGLTARVDLLETPCIVVKPPDLMSTEASLS